MQLEERDRLIADYGLIIVGGDINEKGEVTPRELVSNQAAKVLESAGEGSLGIVNQIFSYFSISNSI